MGVLHDDEFSINGGLVRQLVSDQFPEWGSLSLSRIPSAGTVHAIYRLGSEMTVRLPRLAAFTPALERESRLLPRLAPLLPLRIPELVALGEPTDAYPSTWSILKWIDGETLEKSPVVDSVDVAERLAEFLVAMRSVGIDGEGSTNRRGEPLASSDDWTRQSIASVADEFDHHELTSVWEAALAAPPWDGMATWIHGDLLPGNLIVVDGRLSAIIDFGECSIGNPTCDLIAAWWVFQGESRAAFIRTTQADPDSWARARGWALSSAVGALSYYRNTNPAFADLARRTLRNVLRTRQTVADSNIAED